MTDFFIVADFSLWLAQASPDTSAWAEQMRAVFVRSRELAVPCVAIDVVGCGRCVHVRG